MMNPESKQNFPIVNQSIFNDNQDQQNHYQEMMHNSSPQNNPFINIGDQDNNNSIAFGTF
jgi:hypothetical protein